MSTNNAEFLLSRDANDALLAYLISQYTERSSTPLGDATLQRLCYFAEAVGVPLSFRFERCHYGPFSVDLPWAVGNLLVDDVIHNPSNDPTHPNYRAGPNMETLLKRYAHALDVYRADLDSVAEAFSRLSLNEMKVATALCYARVLCGEVDKLPPSKRKLISWVYKMRKAQFDKGTTAKVYDVLKNAGLLGFAK